MLIGICGKMGTGKTTLAEYARDEFGFKVMSFASGVKNEIIEWLIAANVPYDRCQFFGTQEEKARPLVIPIDALTDEMLECTFIPANYFATTFETTGRELMQWWGSEFRRKQNPNYWLEKLMYAINPSELTIIDDLRFPNEADMVKVCGGRIIRVNRYIEYKSEAQAKHRSEVALDDYPASIYIQNNGITLYQFRELCHDSIKLLINSVV